MGQQHIASQASWFSCNNLSVRHIRYNHVTLRIETKCKHLRQNVGKMTLCKLRIRSAVSKPRLHLATTKMLLLRLAASSKWLLSKKPWRFAAEETVSFSQC